MSSIPLPTEMLRLVFSQPALSQGDLAALVRVSKHFSATVKPYLYSHVLIHNYDQLQKLKQAKKEDVELVRKVIVGNGNPWTIGDMPEVIENFGTFGVVEDAAGCVKDLIEGKVIDLKSESLRSLLEFPKVTRLR
jgi:hypothetical protein